MDADGFTAGIRLLLSGGGGQGGFLVRIPVDGAGSYSVARGAGLLPTELTGMWGWILLRSPHQGRGPPPGPAPTKQRPGRDVCRVGGCLCLVLHISCPILLHASL